MLPQFTFLRSDFCSNHRFIAQIKGQNKRRTAAFGRAVSKREQIKCAEFMWGGANKKNNISITKQDFDLQQSPDFAPRRIGEALRDTSY